MKRKLVILTGAGISAESGISTFRDSGGLWDNYPVEDVATPEGWTRNPELVLRFYNERRHQLLQAQPNGGHIGLAELEEEFEVYIITQNIDNLHERGGSSRVMHLHGELMKARSSQNDNLIYDIHENSCDIKLGDRAGDGSQLRPHIVWFGEAVPMIENAIEWTKEADIFVIIGTSLVVYPAAGLLSYVQKGVPVFLIDPNPVNMPVKREPPIIVIQKRASEGVKELSEILKSSYR